MDVFYGIILCISHCCLIGHAAAWITDFTDSDWRQLGNRLSRKCIPIPRKFDVCYGVGYKEMRLPNLLEHDTMKEVIMQASHWKQLIHTGCHANLRIFLCSLYAPLCTDQMYDRVLRPCHSLCTAVRDGCLPHMRTFGFSWPEILRCNQFPNGNELCIQRQEQKAECQECGLMERYETLASYYCMSDVVVKGKVRKVKKRSRRNRSDQIYIIKLRNRKRNIAWKLPKDLDMVKLRYRTKVAGSCNCTLLDQMINGNKDSLLIMGVSNGRRKVTVKRVFLYSIKLRDILNNVKRRKDCLINGSKARGLNVSNDP